MLKKALEQEWEVQNSKAATNLARVRMTTGCEFLYNLVFMTINVVFEFLDNLPFST